MLTGIKNFALAITYSAWAVPGLALIAFAESSFFPLPPDTIMIPLALLSPNKAFFYAAVATIFSVLGGLFGYFIGNKGGKPVVRKFISDAKIERVRELYQKYDVWAVLIGAFTPLPYKVFTIAAGLMDLNVKRFMLASLVGRGGRFFAVATVIYFLGPAAKAFLSQYFDIAVIAFTVLLIGGIFLANKFLSKKSTA
ncbi:MAG: DedA family protein [Candidatus Roizmanbacteria bacterium]|nr:DedA family protein [Candidatus Roizmanbacteria bacterium]